MYPRKSAQSAQSAFHSFRPLNFALMSVSVITKPKVHIAPDLLKQLRDQPEEAGQVIIHFIFRNLHPWSTLIRIWPTTYLYDQDSDHISELVHAENISMYPTWQEVPPLSQSFFTLIFSGLPKSCSVFDFEEVCDGAGGEFALSGISRNEMDVYYIEVA